MRNEVNTIVNEKRETNVNDEEITLAPPIELINEAKYIAQNTKDYEKFPFDVHYDINQKDFLIFMLHTISAVIEMENDEKHTISTSMNMAQLAFIKRLECVKRIKTDEGSNPFLEEEAKSFELRATQFNADAVSVENIENLSHSISIVDKIATPVGVVTAKERDMEMATTSAATSSESSCCPGPTNYSKETAQRISDESCTAGYICCPCAEQWFKFRATRTGKYTIYTTGSLDTIGTLYDSNGNKMVEVDDYAPCGKINFRIVKRLTAGTTYYVKVRLNCYDTGSYMLRVTENILADYVTINKNTIVLEKGVLYELPVTTNYVYRGYRGARPITGLSVTISPNDTSNDKIYWREEYGTILDCSYGYDEDGNRFIHVMANDTGTAKLYASDLVGHGNGDECTVEVLTSYESILQKICGFSSEEANLILKLYNKVDTIFSAESTLEKAWRCARLLSEFCYDDPFSILGVETPINYWDYVASSVTTKEDIKTYFINTLGYSESEYNKLYDSLTSNHNTANKKHEIMDFTHMQYALAARLAYVLELDNELSNLGPNVFTGNLRMYTDEEVSYLGGWFGDAVLTDLLRRGTSSMQNEDYIADLDAENIYRLMIQGKSSIDAINEYYSVMTQSNNRANIFLQYIPYNTVKEKIFYELIDAQLERAMFVASIENDAMTIESCLRKINDEQYHFDVIKADFKDTYNFLKSLEDGRETMGNYVY